jgi:TatD family-associated radical SAM protein
MENVFYGLNRPVATKSSTMSFAYRYDGRVYLNPTNRCTNRCSFCLRNSCDGLGEAKLWLEEEPDLKGLLTAVDAQGPTSEIVWCGFGEPTFRLDLIVEAAPWLKRNGTKIRLNTNGHACLIHGRDVLPQLAESVDKVSVSLNAPNFEKYVELCLPDVKSVETACVQDLQPFWGATLDFLRRAPDYFKEVQASIVRYALTSEEIAGTKALAQSLGVASFRIR